MSPPSERNRYSPSKNTQNVDSASLRGYQENIRVAYRKKSIYDHQRYSHTKPGLINMKNKIQGEKNIYALIKESDVKLTKLS